jgi:hypothetical protein
MKPEEVRQKENLGPMQSPTNDSPGEVEDTPGDMGEDVAEVAAGTSKDTPADVEDDANGG